MYSTFLYKITTSGTTYWKFLKGTNKMYKKLFFLQYSMVIKHWLQSKSYMTLIENTGVYLSSTNIIFLISNVNLNNNL